MENNAYKTEGISEYIRGIDQGSFEDGCIYLPEPRRFGTPCIEAKLYLGIDHKYDLIIQSGLDEKLECDPMNLTENDDVKVFLLSYFPDTVKLVVAYEDSMALDPYTACSVQLSKDEEAYLKDQLDRYIIETTPYDSQYEYIALHSIDPIMMQSKLDKIIQDLCPNEPNEPDEAELERLKVTGQAMSEVLENIKPKQINFKHIDYSGHLISTVLLNNVKDLKKVFDILPDVEGIDQDKVLSQLCQFPSPKLEFISHLSNDSANLSFNFTFKQYGHPSKKRTVKIEINIPPEVRSEINSKVSKGLGIDLKRYAKRSFKCVVKDYKLDENNNLSVPISVPVKTKKDLILEGSDSWYWVLHQREIKLNAIISEDKEVSLLLEGRREKWDTKLDESIQKDILEAFEEKYGSVDKCFKKEKQKKINQKKKVGMGM